jgi:AraC-like DNA-binding protein
MRDDLQRFASSVHGGASVEALSDTEQRVRWRAQDRAGQTQITALRSGLSLMTAQVSWDRPWSLAVHQAASPLKFMLLRGEGPHLKADDGEARHLSGATFHVSQIKHPLDLLLDFGTNAGTSHHAELALEIDHARLCELLGTADLPEVVNSILHSQSAYADCELPMSPVLSRLFDEIASCDARGRSRQLHLDAKGLELLAAFIDVLDDNERAPQLSRYDVERIEVARKILLRRLADPPSVPELARSAGVSETKLKVGFRVLFGRPVYTYLRECRMAEAQRLLRERRYSVTEIALRVGYANPSKFAAAFRKHFGVPPARS